MTLLLVVVGIGAAVALAGLVYQRVGAAKDARRFPPPGRLFAVGSGEAGCAKLHINCSGVGSPAVIFEAGMASTSLGWSLVQSEIAKIARTASYDRFGLGWSDPVADTRDIGQVVSQLHALLNRAGLTGPRILVGHSYGGLIARAYAARYPSEVVGMVLVDPVAVCEWSEPDPSHRKMLRQGILISRFCALLARLGVVRLAMNHGNAVTRIFSKRKSQTSNGSRGLTSLDRIVGEVKKLPREVWPAVQSHWCQPKCFDGMAHYLKALPASAAAVVKQSPESGAEREIPLIVLSAGNASPLQRAEHQELARNSTQGQIETVANSGHWMHFDQPDVVIQAIKEMVALSKTGGEGGIRTHDTR